MNIDINKPDFTEIEITTYLVCKALDLGDLIMAKQYTDELIQLINTQKKLKNEWKDLFYSIANKF